jgi:hypothetical protein
MIKEEDQKSILMIGGIQIFLPHRPEEVGVCVADTTVEGQPILTVKEEEALEQMLKTAQAKKDEHSEKWLKIFSREAEMEKTAALELAAEEAEEETDIMSLADLCKEIESLERRVKVQRLHIQQAKLEADEGGFQSEEQLERARDTPVGELAEVKLSED